jgi:Ni/Co efflux regulator RcnB
MRIFSRRKLALALFCTGIFAFSPVFADKPDWAGQGKPGKGAKEGKKGDPRGGRDKARAAYFGDHHRTAAREYFDESFRAGRCPPGLAKKHNGCLPPGQAKKWNMGRPLPRDVIFYDLPPTVVVRLGPPPSGHRFVRVANDILLIAIGTGMVIDAIQDLGR